jgi:hypothetical protein
MGDIKSRRGAEKPADIEQSRRYRLHGVLTGAGAPTDAERRHLQGRGALAILAAALCEEPKFWRDIDRLRDAIDDVDPTASDAEQLRVTNPAWQQALSYGVRGTDHRTLIAVALLTAARQPTRSSARTALLQLGAHPVTLDGEPRGRARHDVTRLVQGARMVVAYRAGHCGAPDCRQSRRGRYCRSHSTQTTRHRQWEEARQWALDQAVHALRPSGWLRAGEYAALWLIAPRSELRHGQAGSCD